MNEKLTQAELDALVKRGVEKLEADITRMLIAAGMKETDAHKLVAEARADAQAQIDAEDAREAEEHAAEEERMHAEIVPMLLTAAVHAMGGEFVMTVDHFAELREKQIIGTVEVNKVRGTMTVRATTGEQRRAGAN